MKGSDYFIILILIAALGVLGFLFTQQEKSAEEIFSDISEKVTGSSGDPTSSAPENNTNEQNPNNTYIPPVTNPPVTTATNLSLITQNCGPDDQPSIKIIYPNGGEVFTTKQKIDIKWITCNISSSSSLQIGLMQGDLESENLEGPGGFGITLANSTINDGDENIDFSEKSFDGDYDLSSGRSNFRVTVSEVGKNLYEPGVVFDVSDTFFTINK